MQEYFFLLLKFKEVVRFFLCLLLIWEHSNNQQASTISFANKNKVNIFDRLRYQQHILLVTMHHKLESNTSLISQFPKTNFIYNLQPPVTTQLIVVARLEQPAPANISSQFYLIYTSVIIIQWRVCLLTTCNNTDNSLTIKILNV